MKAFCCECGRPVPIKIGPDGKAVFGHCREHPNAKRFKESTVKSWFGAIHAAIDAAKNAGAVYSGGANFWSVMDSRARAGKGGAS